MHFLAKLFSFIYIEPILSYVFLVHQIIINLEAEHSMQPINFFLGFRAIWIPHCFDCAFNTILFNVFFELPSIIIV